MTHEIIEEKRKCKAKRILEIGDLLDRSVVKSANSDGTLIFLSSPLSPQSPQSRCINVLLSLQKASIADASDNHLL